jgi:hypothetical protein
MTEDVHAMDTPAGITSPDGEAITFDWDARLRAAVEATITARDRRRNERAAMNTARTYGLAQRHATKLARNRGPARTALERNTEMDREQIAQETAEHIAAKGEQQSTDTVQIHYIGGDKPPTDVQGIKAALLDGRIWISWMDDTVTAAMRQIHADDGPVFTPQERVGSKANCGTCGDTLAYGAGPEGDFYWQHQNGPDDWHLIDATEVSSSTRTFVHGRPIDPQ